MNPTAFVIEDDEDLSTIYAQALESVGFDVEILRDGAVAQERLNVFAPDVILLDMHLPQVSGAELLKMIEGNERFTRTIVVIATADAALGNKYRNKANRVMLKPIMFNQLRELKDVLPKDQEKKDNEEEQG